jgi:hypothetical protein
MTLAELFTILKTAGFPVAYHHFSTPPQPPYIVYLSAYSSNFVADNKVHHRIPNIQVELYTTKKDLAAEAKLEIVFDNNEIPYESTETYIASEGLFQKIYEVRLI